MEALSTWLSNLGQLAFSWSVAGLILVDGAFAAAVFATRDRLLVNRWAPRVLGVNLVLLGTGGGIPLLAWGARLAVQMATALTSPEGQAATGK